MACAEGAQFVTPYDAVPSHGCQLSQLSACFSSCYAHAGFYREKLHPDWATLHPGGLSQLPLEVAHLSPLSHLDTPETANHQRIAARRKTFELISRHLQRLQLIWFFPMLHPRTNIPFAHSLHLSTIHIRKSIYRFCMK